MRTNGKLRSKKSGILLFLLAGPRPKIRRVLLCTGAGEPGKLDVLFGAEIARSTGAAVTLLYVDDQANLATGTTDLSERSLAWSDRPVLVVKERFES